MMMRVHDSIQFFMLILCFVCGKSLLSIPVILSQLITSSVLGTKCSMGMIVSMVVIFAYNMMDTSGIVPILC